MNIKIVRTRFQWAQWTTLIVALTLFSGIASALRINQSDIGTPLKKAEAREPEGFRTAHGWTIYWGSSCQAARGLMIMWVVSCDDKQQIRFLSRRKLNVLEKTGKTNANYLPMPFNSGHLSYSASDLLAELVLHFDEASLGQVENMLTESLGHAPTRKTVASDEPNAKSSSHVLVWTIGNVHAVLDERNATLDRGRLRMSYLPLTNINAPQ